MSKSFVGGGIAALVGVMVISGIIGWFGSRRASDFPTISAPSAESATLTVPATASQVATTVPVANGAPVVTPARPASLTRLKGLKLVGSAITYEFRDDLTCVMTTGLEEVSGTYREYVSSSGRKLFKLSVVGSTTPDAEITWTAETDRYTGTEKVHLHYESTGRNLTFDVLRPKF